MRPSDMDGQALPRDQRNTARPTRGRFGFQDQCIALRCAENLVRPEIEAVVVEWSSDYVALPRSGLPELVSIKHRERDQSPWTPSELTKPVADLHRYWRELGEACRCVFSSSRGVQANHVEELRRTLAKRLAVSEAEAARFWDVFGVTVLPDRSELPACGRDTVRGVLRELDRDPRFAAECWDVLVAAVAATSVEEPPAPQERATRLAGAILNRDEADIAEQTLRLEDLRARVLTRHSDLERRPAPRILVPSRPTRASQQDWAPGATLTVAGAQYRLRGPVEERDLPDGSAVRRSAGAHSDAHDVRINSTQIRRDTVWSQSLRDALQKEADLARALSNVPMAPRLVSLAEAGATVTLVIAPASSSSLEMVYGGPDVPYEGLALDAFLRGLRTLGRNLSALHSRGFAHRDLRPETLVVSERGLLALRDYGLATMPATPGEGPAAYRAPEQRAPGRRPVGAHTDTYQLAALVFHVATGRPPGPRPVPVGVLRSEVSVELERVLAAGLRDDPAERPDFGAQCASLTALAGRALRSAG